MTQNFTLVVVLSFGRNRRRGKGLQEFEGFLNYLDNKIISRLQVRQFEAIQSKTITKVHLNFYSLMFVFQTIGHPAYAGTFLLV